MTIARVFPRRRATLAGGWVSAVPVTIHRSVSSGGKLVEPIPKT